MPAFATEPIPPRGDAEPGRSSAVRRPGPRRRRRGRRAHPRAVEERHGWTRFAAHARSFNRDQDAIRPAPRIAASPDLVWLVAELAVSPFARAAARAADRGDHDADAAALDALESRLLPGLRLLAGARRGRSVAPVLRCSFCAQRLGADDLRVHLLRESGDRSSRRRPTKPQDRRVEVCGGCGGYLKTVDLDELSPFPLLAIADLETMDLDIAGDGTWLRRGLKEFARTPAVNAGLHQAVMARQGAADRSRAPPCSKRLEVLARFLLDVLVQAVAVRVHRHDRRELRRR